VADRERQRRQRPQRGSLLTLKAVDGTLVRRAMHTLVGDDHPLCEVRLELSKRVELARREAVVLGVLHAALRLAFGASAIRTARARE
jgi:hypothetical protein